MPQYRVIMWSSEAQSRHPYGRAGQVCAPAPSGPILHSGDIQLANGSTHYHLTSGPAASRSVLYQHNYRGPDHNSPAGPNLAQGSLAAAMRKLESALAEHTHTHAGLRNSHLRAGCLANYLSAKRVTDIDSNIGARWSRRHSIQGLISCTKITCKVCTMHGQT